MEKPPIKIKNLSELTNSLVEKIQLIDSPTLTVKYKMKTFDELLNIVEKLRVFFQVNKTEDNLSFDNQVKRMFEQFNWEVHLLKKPIYDFTKYSEYSKEFLSSLLKILGKRGCGILIIETYTKVCLKTLHDLIANCGHDAKISEDLHNFKLLLEGLSSTTKMFKKYWHVIFLQSQKNATMLCLNQICKGLPFLLKTMEARNNQVKKYIIDRLIHCFNKIIDELHSDGELQPSFGSEFIQLMDAALYNLNQLSRDGIDYPTLVEVSNDVANNLKPLIDELLCHAMSIAQVTSIDNDYKAIIASSQKVLKEFEQLVQNIKDENGPEIKLDATGLSETLCKLEQRVNTAVLRLVLEVFTHVNSPLKNMVNKCRVDSNKDNKYSEDLNILISEFDAEMDKIMQIGLFAVSCSTDVKRILGIKSCLASLESLEAELIPCLTALYMDSNSSNKNIFQFLIEQWLKEITELKILIDSILDPAAFCEVVENQMEELISSIKGSISSTFDVNNVVKSIEKLIRYSKKLIKMLNTSMEEDEVQNTEAFKKLSLDLQLAVQECEASIALLTKDQDVNKNVNRVVKRSELVLSSVHKILEYLFKSLPENESDLQKTKDQCLTLEEKSPFWNSTRLPQKNYYRLCASIPDTTPPPQNIEALTPFLTIGKMRAKERSILYVTPKRTQGLTPITPKPFDSRALRQWDNTPRSRNRSRCCKPLPLNLELGNTLDLEVTTVLENLSELSNTFSKSFSETQNATACKILIEAGSGQEKDIDDTKPLTSSGCRTDFHDKPEDEKDVENFLGDKLRTQLFQSLDELTQSSSLLVSTESNDLYTTQERLKDLKIVEQRINFLQSEVPEVFF